MADLDDIDFELNPHEKSIDLLDSCPPPPRPFQRSYIDQDIIVEPPTVFDDQEETIHTKSNVPFDTIFFNDAKIYLFETTTADDPSPLNETMKKSSDHFFRRVLNFFRSAITSSNDHEFNRQYEQILHLAKHPCNMSDRIHTRILYTIYRRLTNSKEIFYTTLGPQWEQIGFQSSNPETDFRSTGLFSIFFLLYFVDSMYLPLAKEIYQLSQDEQQQFPFCCIGINLANILIKNLRQASARANIRKLIGEKRLETSLIDSLGKLYLTLYLSFYLQWKENVYTIVNTQQVLTELEQTLNRRPKVLFEDFENYFRRKQSESHQTSRRSQHYELKQKNDNLI